MAMLRREHTRIVVIVWVTCCFQEFLHEVGEIMDYEKQPFIVLYVLCIIQFSPMLSPQQEQNVQYRYRDRCLKH